MIKNVICTECEEKFEVMEPEVSEVLSCPECGLSLLVTSIDHGKVIVELTDTDPDDWGE